MPTTYTAIATAAMAAANIQLPSKHAFDISATRNDLPPTFTHLNVMNTLLQIVG